MSQMTITHSNGSQTTVVYDPGQEVYVITRPNAGATAGKDYTWAMLAQQEATRGDDVIIDGHDYGAYDPDTGSGIPNDSAGG